MLLVQEHNTNYTFIKKFELKNNDLEDSAYTDLLLLNSFSNRNLRIYSEGGAITRFDKTEKIIDNELVQNHLHVCFAKIHNCGKCIKCVQTVSTLYALGKLDKYYKVFDIDYFMKHKRFYLSYLYMLHIQGGTITERAYQLLKKEITLKIKIYGVLRLLREKYRIWTKNKKYYFDLTKEFW